MLFFRLFRKVDPNCAYCRHGTRISERDVVCLKHGVVPVEHHCRAFRYDPLKRTPPRPAVLRLGGLGEADFSLEGAVPGQETLFAGMDAAGTDAAGMDGLGTDAAGMDAASAETEPSGTPDASRLTEETALTENPAEPDGTAAPGEPEETALTEEPEEAALMEEPKEPEESALTEEAVLPEEPEEPAPETREESEKRLSSASSSTDQPPEKTPRKVKVRTVKFRR